MNEADEAANRAVQTAVAAAQVGTSSGKTAYGLTQKMLKDGEAPLILPLLGLTAEAITDALTTYTTTVLNAKAAGLKAIPTPTDLQKIKPLNDLIKRETEAVFWAPLSLELSILGKFLADEIKKLPAVAILPAIGAAIEIIEGVSETAVSTRDSFTEVPQPKPLVTPGPDPNPPFFPLPIPPPLTKALPFTTQWIEKQTQMLQEYLPVAVATE